LKIKTRKELLDTIKPHHREYIRRDTGDIDEDIQPRRPSGPKFIGLVAHGSAAAAVSPLAGV
jgi:hypothetical protein